MDSSAGINLLRKLRVKYCWIYITDRCNLNCKYCFYKFKTGKEKIDFKRIKFLLDSLPNVRDSEFVVSGGEPLMEWDLAAKIIDYINSKYNKFILLQTNGILLDRDKISFIKSRNVGLELGLDGKSSNFVKYRGGTKAYFNKIINNINILKSNKIKVFATMTVCQKEAGRVFENYKYLLDLGVDKVEITPAAFEEWDERGVIGFKKGYRKVLRYAVARKNLGSISIEYDKPLKGGFIDLIVLPDNNILTNWALLSLPSGLKRRFSMFRINKQTVSINKDFIKLYFGKYLELFDLNQDVSYRDYSNLNVEWVYRKLFKRCSEASLENYKKIGSFLKDINRKMPVINRKAG